MPENNLDSVLTIPICPRCGSPTSPAHADKATLSTATNALPDEWMDIRSVDDLPTESGLYVAQDRDDLYPRLFVFTLGRSENYWLKTKLAYLNRVVPDRETKGSPTAANPFGSRKGVI